MPPLPPPAVRLLAIGLLLGLGAPVSAAAPPAPLPRDEALRQVIERFNAAQKATGELQELAECDHKGARYYKRVERNQVNYYAFRGPILLFTGQEAVLQAALERERCSGLSPPVTARLRKL